MVDKHCTEKLSDVRLPKVFEIGEPTSEYTALLETQPEVLDRKFAVKHVQRVLSVLILVILEFTV
jgi:hypothetical protein